MMLDATAAYNALRLRKGMPTHDDRDPIDVIMMDLFLAGVSLGTMHTLEQIKEQRTTGAPNMGYFPVGGAGR